MDPLLDTQGRASSRRHVTVRDGKAGLPYSKGLMAQSVMAAGLPPYTAFHVAEVIEERLHAGGRVAITSSELRQLAAGVLESEVGPQYADSYRLWQLAQDRTIPLIVLIGGATGVGKSTIATTVANRLGIVRIVSTDSVREVMRRIFTKEMMPALHTSSFDVTALLQDPARDGDPVIAGFRQQVRAVAVGLTQIIRRAVLEGTDIIVEGAHVVPGFLRFPSRHEAVVAATVITVDDQHTHRSHFVARASTSAIGPRSGTSTTFKTFARSRSTSVGSRWNMESRWSPALAWTPQSQGLWSSSSRRRRTHPIFQPRKSNCRASCQINPDVRQINSDLYR